MFADRYLQRNMVYPSFIDSEPESDLKTVVVIPCFREPEIQETLNSLFSCIAGAHSVEVIVVVNQPEDAEDWIGEINQQTLSDLQEWGKINNKPGFSLHLIGPLLFMRKHAGAGMARKVGMDEAVRRFVQCNQPHGLIVSLDADTLVSPNYFIEIEKAFADHTHWVGATIAFKHRVDSLSMTEKQLEGIDLYERYMHYYKQAVAYTGHPSALFTIGSAFCCRVDAYVKQGGMNRRQAGEDFYFLHKLSQLGVVGEINSACVYPLARLSDRVPFGTGPILQRWLHGEEDLSETWNFRAFIDLKELFDCLEDLYGISTEKLTGLLEILAEPMQKFLSEINFTELLNEVNANAGSPEAFRKRFFHMFDAFRILKYVHFSHQIYYSKQPVEQVEKMLSEAL